MTPEMPDAFNYLNIEVEVRRGDFTDPNKRIIKVKLMFGDQEISTSSTYFDVVQKQEYEG